MNWYCNTVSYLITTYFIKDATPTPVVGQQRPQFGGVSGSNFFLLRNTTIYYS